MPQLFSCLQTIVDEKSAEQSTALRTYAQLIQEAAEAHGELEKSSVNRLRIVMNTLGRSIEQAQVDIAGLLTLQNLVLIAGGENEARARWQEAVQADHDIQLEHKIQRERLESDRRAKQATGQFNLGDLDAFERGISSVNDSERRQRAAQAGDVETKHQTYQRAAEAARQVKELRARLAPILTAAAK